MSIADMLKITIVGDVRAKTTLLDRIQETGVLHLLPIVEHQEQQTGNHYDQLKEAIDYLENSPRKRRPQTPEEALNLKQLIKNVLRNKHARSAAQDKLEMIRTRKIDLAPWGDFNYPDLDDIGGYRFWFYQIPLSKKKHLQQVSLPWKILGEDHKQCYLVVVAEEEPSEQEVPFVRVHVGSQSLTELDKELDSTLVELEELNAEREALTRWIYPLTLRLDDALNLEKLQHAARQTFDTDDCFAMRAWIPKRDVKKLSTLKKQLPFAFYTEEPKSHENPPTMLENNDLFGGGEAAVSFFQLPGYRSWDPSSMIFVSFSLFFAIIVADSAYGLILLAFLALFRKKLSGSPLKLRIRNLALSMSISSIIYGVFIGSYFGIKLNPDGWLAQLAFLDLHDFSTMMKFSIGIGALHLIAASAFSGWHKRKSIQALAHLGWILVIASGYCSWLFYVNDDIVPSLSSISGMSFVCGLLLAVIFSSTQKIKSGKDLGLRLMDGVLEIYKLTKAFGDVLSYMRLFALGLSSASLAVTFNHLAHEALESAPHGGFLLYIFIIFFGHTLNFLLAMVGGIIHGLRLNLLEFYAWGIEGEGHPFKAFKYDQHNSSTDSTHTQDSTN